MPVTSKLQLTLSGVNRLNRLTQSTIVHVAKLLYSGVNTITKQQISNAAPDREAEGREISRGMVLEDGANVGKMVGTSGKRRFLKPAGFMSIPEAIESEIPTSEFKKNIVWSHFGNPDKLNQRLGFGWESKKGMRTTKDADAHSFWSTNYIQAWDYGGATFVVSARDPNGKLSPQENMRVSKMQKTILPRSFFSRGYHKSKGKLIKFMSKELHMTVQMLDRGAGI